MSTRPTRSQLIGTVVSDAVLQTRMTWRAYASAVVDHYHANVAVEDRLVDFHVATTADNALQATEFNTQTVRRTLIGEIRMHVDLEESLVAALPDAWRDKLTTLLLERQGLLLARRPAATDATPRAQFSPACELMHSTADAIQRISPMLVDNRIGPDDEPHFESARRGLDMVVGACITIKWQMDQVQMLARREGLH